LSCRVGAAAERLEGRSGPAEVLGPAQVERGALANRQMAAELMMGVLRL
jgi:hypothetical protein